MGNEVVEKSWDRFKNSDQVPVVSAGGMPNGYISTLSAGERFAWTSSQERLLCAHSMQQSWKSRLTEKYNGCSNSYNYKNFWLLILNLFPKLKKSNNQHHIYLYLHIIRADTYRTHGWHDLVQLVFFLTK